MGTASLMDKTRQGVRVDKWLWAARFFKTRQLAVAAIEHGKVRVNDMVVKASRELRGGELLVLQVAEQTWEIEVMGVSEQRGPAPVARALYRETPEGAKRRIDVLEARLLAPEPARQLQGRPTKRERRMLATFKSG